MLSLVFISFLVYSKSNKHLIKFKDNALNSNNIEIEASYGFYMNKLGYNGKEIEVDVTLDNGIKDCELGIIIFVNGIPQPYYTNDYRDTKYIIPYSINKFTKKNIKIAFTPITGNIGETLTILFGCMLNPSIEATENMKTFGNNHKLLFLEPYFIESKYNYGEVKILKCNNFINLPYQEDNDTYKCIVTIDNNEVDRIDIGNKLRLNIELSGKEGNYIILAYINHSLVPIINGKSYYTLVSLKNNQKTIFKIDYEAINLKLNKYNHMYFIMIPLDKDNIMHSDPLFKTNTIILNYIGNE